MLYIFLVISILSLGAIVFIIHKGKENFDGQNHVHFHKHLILAQEREIEHDLVGVALLALKKRLYGGVSRALTVTTPLLMKAQEGIEERKSKLAEKVGNGGKGIHRHYERKGTASSFLRNLNHHKKLLTRKEK